MKSGESCRTEGKLLDKGWVKQLDGAVDLPDRRLFLPYLVLSINKEV